MPLLRHLLPLLLLGALSSCSVYDHFFHPHRLGTPPMTAAAKAKAKAAEKARHKGQSTSLKPADGSGSASGSAAGATEAAPGSVPGTVDPAASAPAADARSLDDKNKAIEDMLHNTYNTKTGLLKRSKWQQMQANSHKLHHYDTRPLTPRDASADARKMRKQTHTKDHGKASSAPTSKERADEPMTDDTPAAKAGPQPKPDPTQPAAQAAPARKAAPAKAAKPPKAAPKAKPAKEPKAKKENPAKAPAAKDDNAKKDKKAKKAPVPKPDPTQPQPFKGDTP